uniref:guanylate cyclase n=1 Tax=Strigamia maritima TaxID=126957 RepID=T1JIL0_STRMM
MEIIELKTLKHENLITFIGACFTAPRVALLVEVAPKGSLADVLLSEAYNLAWAFKFSILVVIAKGMDYLHDSMIGSHGRLKSTNCLIDNRWSCKISDCT